MRKEFFVLVCVLLATAVFADDYEIFRQGNYALEVKFQRGETRESVLRGLINRDDIEITETNPTQYQAELIDAGLNRFVRRTGDVYRIMIWPWGYGLAGTLAICEFTSSSYKYWFYRFKYND